jgi:hypothetical protein
MKIPLVWDTCERSHYLVAVRRDISVVAELLALSQGDLLVDAIVFRQPYARSALRRVGAW